MSSAFVDMPGDSYPFTMAFIRTDNNKVVDVITVSGPGAVHVKPYAQLEGVPIRVRVTTADGSVTYQDPK